MTEHSGDKQTDGLRSKDGPEVFDPTRNDFSVRATRIRPEQTRCIQTYINDRLKAGVWNARVTIRELRRRGYTGGYRILTVWLRPQRESAQVIAVRRFEKPPGRQAQVDWGHFGTIDVDGVESPPAGPYFELVLRVRSEPSGTKLNERQTEFTVDECVHCDLDIITVENTNSDGVKVRTRDGKQLSTSFQGFRTRMDT